MFFLLSFLERVGVFGFALFLIASRGVLLPLNVNALPSQQKISQETSGGEQQGRVLALHTCGPNETGCSNISHFH